MAEDDGYYTGTAPTGVDGNPFYTSPKRKRNSEHRSSKKSNIYGGTGKGGPDEDDFDAYSSSEGEDCPPKLFFSPNPVGTLSRNRAQRVASLEQQQQQLALGKGTYAVAVVSCRGLYHDA
jgi:hypothetical protein